MDTYNLKNIWKMSLRLGIGLHVGTYLICGPFNMLLHNMLFIKIVQL